MQQLKYYCFLGLFEGTYQGFSNWLAINVLGWGVAGSAIAHVSRKVCLFILIYGYLWWLFKQEGKSNYTTAPHLRSM
jgi:Na+-driven multidrug efflux pump